LKKEQAETGKDKAVNNDEIYEPLLLKPATNATWLEVKNIEVSFHCHLMLSCKQ